MTTLRQALRSLILHRGFTLAALVCIALGVGAASAILAVVYAVLVKPLPYESPDRLVAIWESNPELGEVFARTPLSAPAFLELEERSRLLASVTAVTFEPMVITGLDTPQRVSGARVTPAFFQDVFRITPRLGRAFLPSEAESGADAVVLLSDGFWRRALGADPKVIGRKLEIDGASCQVVGVLPSDFVYENPDPESLQRVDLWRPLVVEEYRSYGRGMRFLQVVGRLAPTAGLEPARSELRALAAAANASAGTEGWSLTAVPLQEQLVGHVSRELSILFGAVGLVFLVACANVANLIVVRAVQRGRDLAVRLALGAKRAHVLRLLLGESVLLSLGGGTLGFLLALWMTRVLIALSPVHLPRLHELRIAPDLVPPVILLSVLSALVCALSAAPFAMRRFSSSDLKEGDRGGPSWGQARLRNGLVFAELALAMTLLAGAGLLLKSFWQLERKELGFRPEGVLTVQIELPWARYDEEARILSFYDQLDSRIQALAGVEQVGLTKDLPLSGEGSKVAVVPERRRPSRAKEPPDTVWVRIVSPGYFGALSIPPVEGRLFSTHDVGSEVAAVVVNRALALQLWPEGKPLAERVTVNWFGKKLLASVVGVVGDVRHRSAALPAEPALYLNALDFAYPSTHLVIRGSGDPLRWVPMVRGVLDTLDPDLPIDQVRPMSDLVSAANSSWRFLAVLVGAFAIAALLLAAVGVYGVVAYTVSRNRRQIAIRMALGAEPGTVLRSIVGRFLVLAFGGLAVGGALVLAVRGVLSKVLFEVSAGDPAILAGTAVLLVVVVVTATLIPARRAAQLDPGTTLRSE